MKQQIKSCDQCLENTLLKRDAIHFQYPNNDVTCQVFGVERELPPDDLDFCGLACMNAWMRKDVVRKPVRHG